MFQFNFILVLFKTSIILNLVLDGLISHFSLFYTNRSYIQYLSLYFHSTNTSVYIFIFTCFLYLFISKQRANLKKIFQLSHFLFFRFSKFWGKSLSTWYLNSSRNLYYFNLNYFLLFNLNLFLYNYFFYSKCHLLISD